VAAAASCASFSRSSAWELVALTWLALLAVPSPSSTWPFHRLPDPLTAAACVGTLALLAVAALTCPPVRHQGDPFGGLAFGERCDNVRGHIDPRRRWPPASSPYVTACPAQALVMTSSAALTCAAIPSCRTMHGRLPDPDARLCPRVSRPRIRLRPGPGTAAAARSATADPTHPRQPSRSCAPRPAPLRWPTGQQPGAAGYPRPPLTGQRAAPACELPRCREPDGPRMHLRWTSRIPDPD